MIDHKKDNYESFSQYPYVPITLSRNLRRSQSPHVPMFLWFSLSMEGHSLVEERTDVRSDRGTNYTKLPELVVYCFENYLRKLY